MSGLSWVRFGGGWGGEQLDEVRWIGCVGREWMGLVVGGGWGGSGMWVSGL